MEAAAAEAPGPSRAKGAVAAAQKQRGGVQPAAVGPAQQQQRGTEAAAAEALGPSRAKGTVAAAQKQRGGVQPAAVGPAQQLSLNHISEPTRPY